MGGAFSRHRTSNRSVSAFTSPPSQGGHAAVVPAEAPPAGTQPPPLVTPTALAARNQLGQQWVDSSDSEDDESKTYADEVELDSD